MKKEAAEHIQPNKDTVQIDQEKLNFKIVWILEGKSQVYSTKERSKRVII